MPFWMVTLGSRLLGPDSSIEIPYANLAISLLMLTIPIAIGMIIKYVEIKGFIFFYLKKCSELFAVCVRSLTGIWLCNLIYYMH